MGLPDEVPVSPFFVGEGRPIGLREFWRIWILGKGTRR